MFKIVICIWRMMVFVLLIMLIFSSTIVLARPVASVKYNSVREEASRYGKEMLVLPYVLSTESMGSLVGVGGSVKGFGQEQLLIGATAFSSADDAEALYLGIWDLRLPWLNRLYISALGSTGYYPRQRAYAEYPDNYTGVKAGSHDSSPDDYVEDAGHKKWLDVSLEYVLPMGAARDQSMIKYFLKDGMLVSKASGGRRWNPLECGVTILIAQQRNMYQSYETDLGEIDGVIHPVDFGLLYDNTDFSPNPTVGSRQYVGSTHGVDWGDAEESWRFVELEMSKFISLSDSATARQRVIGLNFWTGYSPTWKQEIDEDGNISNIDNPPFFEGATLGGYYRMRGYPTDRFNDKAVLYTSAEYRHTLRWNPLKNISLLRFLQTDWLQLVASFEGGRVAPEYDSDLLEDWNVCGGIGIRAMMAGGVFRFDINMSDEAVNGWAMVGHPF